MRLPFHDVLLAMIQGPAGLPGLADGLLDRLLGTGDRAGGDFLAAARLRKAIGDDREGPFPLLAAGLALDYAPRLMSGRHLLAYARVAAAGDPVQRREIDAPGTGRDLAARLIRSGAVVPIGFSTPEDASGQVVRKVDDLGALAGDLDLDAYYANSLARHQVDAIEAGSILGSPEGATRKAVATMRSVLKPASRIDVPGGRGRIHLATGGAGPGSGSVQNPLDRLPRDKDLDRTLVVAELVAMGAPGSEASRCIRRTPFGSVIYRHLPGYDLERDIGRFTASRLAEHPTPSPLLGWPSAERQLLLSLGGIDLVRPDGRLEIHLVATREGALIDWLVAWRHGLSRAPSHWIDLGEMDTELVSWLAVRNNLGLWLRSWLEIRRAAVEGRIAVRDFDHAVEGRMAQARRPTLATVSGSDAAVDEAGTIDDRILASFRAFSADPERIKRFQDMRGPRHAEMIGIGDGEMSAFDREIERASHGLEGEAGVG